MVSRIEKTPGTWQFVLRPNCSATPAQVRAFFLVIALVSISIASAFAVMGFWPVLPFAGAELAFLWWCLSHTSERARDTEVIDINDQTVHVARGRRAPEQRWSFQRAWARIRVEPAPVRLHPSRLLLGSHGRHVQLGRFLSEDERLSLAGDLRRALGGR